MEGTPILNACNWLAENPSKSVAVATRLFGVLESSIRSRIAQLAQPQRQIGGLNKMLTATQIEALKKWIVRQYELGLGATRQMTFAAICQLRNPLLPPSQSWLTKFIKTELQEFHFITTSRLHSSVQRHKMSLLLLSGLRIINSSY